MSRRSGCIHATRIGLIKILHDLRDLGNTILVVEHDPDIMRAADRILDLGPGAGENGGKLVAEGTYDEILHNPVSLTGRYLSEDLRIQPPALRRKPGAQQIRIRGVRANNLKGVDIAIPLGMLVAITGVSGSGKSTLLHQVLYRALAQAKQQSGNGATGPAASWESLEGDQFIEEVVLVDQSPIGRTPRSNPVTYIKAFDAIRDLFASLPEAKKRGFGAGHFSFNIPGGRCETCQGDGTVTVEMQFLADVELICEECKGTRYKPTGARSALPRQEYSRSAEPDREGSAEVFCRSAKDHREAADRWRKSDWDTCGWGSRRQPSQAARRNA